MSLLTPEYDNVYVSLEQLAGTLEQLYRHKTTLLKTPLICQSDALSLEALVPGMISNRLPVASYTTDMSPVNVTPTVESIGDQLRSIRDRIVKVFKDLWAKLVGWFNSTFRDSAKKSDQAKKDAKDAQDKTNAIEPVEDKVINAITAEMSDKAGQPIKPAEVIATLHEESVKVLEQHTSHNAYMVARNTGYPSLFKNMAGTANVLKNLTAACEKLTATINAGGEVDTALYVVDLTSLGKLVDPSAKDAASTIEVLRGLAKLVADGRRPEFAEGDLKDLTDPKIQKFLKTSADLGNTIDDLQAVIETERGMDAVTKAIDHLDGSVKKIESPENASKVNTVIAEFRHVATVIGMIFGVVKDLHADVCITAAALNKAANGRYKALFSAINELPDRDDWLKQMASMKRSVGLESADFEVEDSVFEGNDSSDELSFDSHEVDEAHAVELTKSLDDDHTEVNNLMTTSTTLENMGIESFADTIKGVANKIVEAIKAFIARMKAWMKSIWAKLTTGNSDIAKEADKAEQAEQAENKISKDAEHYTNELFKQAAEANNTAPDKQTAEQKSVIRAAELLTPPTDTEAKVPLKAMRYESLYDALLKRHYDAVPHRLLFPDTRDNARRLITDELLVVIKHMTANIDDLIDSATFLQKMSDDEAGRWIGTDIEAKFLDIINKFPFTIDVPGLVISRQNRNWDPNCLKSASSYSMGLMNYAGDFKAVMGIYNYSAPPESDSAKVNAPVLQLSVNELKTLDKGVKSFVKQLKGFNSKPLEKIVASLEKTTTALQADNDSRDRSKMEANEKMSRTYHRLILERTSDLLMAISRLYQYVTTLSMVCTRYFKTVNAVQKRRLRSLKEAATIMGKLDTTLIPDAGKAAQAMMAALDDPNVTAIIL